MKRLSLLLLLSTGLLFLQSGKAPSSYIVGDIADDFELPSTTGHNVSLTSLGDVKGYIIVFTCNHCPYAQQYEDRIIALHRKYAPLGFPVIAINPNSPEVFPEDSFEFMKERADEKKFPFEYLQDENQTVYPRFGATRTPHTFVLDSERTIQYIGAIDDNPEAPSLAKKHYVEDAVNALLQGEIPEIEFTNAIGCMIKKKPDTIAK